MGLILARVFIAFPFLAIMSGLVSAAALILIQKAVGKVIDDIAITASILYFLEIVVYTGMIFAFEAAILRSAREHGIDEARWEREAERRDTSDLRAIRDRWSERG